jgi:hypothetical protein
MKLTIVIVERAYLFRILALFNYCDNMLVSVGRYNCELQLDDSQLNKLERSEYAFTNTLRTV